MTGLKIGFILVFALGFVLSLFSQNKRNQLANRWEEVLKSKTGAVTVYWYTSRPFIYKSANGKMAGIEYEILEEFSSYLKRAYDVSLRFNWVEAESFYATFEKVQANKQSGIFGVSNFSFTRERANHVSFSPPYMMDISVLISSGDVPIANNEIEFDQVFNTLKAISIEGTTYEKDLLEMKKGRNLNFEIEFIPSSENILVTIEKSRGSFGYIDLPVYLTTLSRNAALKLKRQNLFSVQRDGYAIIYSQNSDWKQPLEEFLSDKAHTPVIENIIIKYMDKNVYDFIKNFYLNTHEDVILLTKEKEIQRADLFDKSEQIEREATLRAYLIVAIVFIGLFFMATAWLYVTKSRANVLLSHQKQMIESQRSDIEQQKHELEKRNEQLELMDQEKNHIINILAHDLRAPLSQITGLAQLARLEGKSNGFKEQYTGKIIESAERLLKMISKILDVDAIEKKRVNLSTDTIEVVGLVKKVVEDFQKTALQKNITLNFHATEPSSILIADELYLRQVLENLISNAIKFSHHDKPVNVGVRNSDNRVKISVQDEGPGIKAEEMTKLFQKYRILSAKPTGGEQSTGLGLSIVKQYVEHMKGEVQCESTFGQGATFTISFAMVP